MANMLMRVRPPDVIDSPQNDGSYKILPSKLLHHPFREEQATQFHNRKIDMIDMIKSAQNLQALSAMRGKNDVFLNKSWMKSQKLQ